MKTPHANFEARLYVRDNDGQSLIIPEHDPQLSHQRLSYSIDVQAGDEPHFDRLQTALRESTTQDDDQNHLAGFIVQRFIGKREWATEQPAIHGYLAQRISTELSGALANHRILELQEARESLRRSRLTDPLPESADIDYIHPSSPIDAMDRMLGSSAFTMIAATIDRTETATHLEPTARETLSSLARLTGCLLEICKNDPLNSDKITKASEAISKVQVQLGSIKTLLPQYAGIEK